VGDGTKLRRPTPVTVQGGPFTDLVAGASHGCALIPSGTPYCWGRNTYAELGDGSVTQRSAPAPVTGAPALASLAKGGAALHTCGLDSAGAAWCWGFNGVGQLGDGTTGDDLVCTGVTSPPFGCRPSPVPVVGSSTFTSLVTGRYHTCGLMGVGIAYCWGDASRGQVGDGTTGSAAACPDGFGGCRLTPTAVSGGLTFTDLAAGNKHTCGLTSSGQAYCWGDNGFYQLGNGTSTASSTPVPVGGGHSFVAIWASSAQVCALDGDGLAYCWGENLFGQLGDGTAFNFRSLPTPVSGGISFTRLSMGAAHTCGLTASGSAYCWGLNADAQLGDGSATQRTVPTLVASGGVAF
jgi:alpha-tubulin suppressor-like RCC1 family protein